MKKENLIRANEINYELDDLYRQINELDSPGIERIIIKKEDKQFESIIRAKREELVEAKEKLQKEFNDL